jgi:hypothetical protein
MLDPMVSSSQLCIRNKGLDPDHLASSSYQKLDDIYADKAESGELQWDDHAQRD